MDRADTGQSVLVAHGGIPSEVIIEFLPRGSHPANRGTVRKWPRSKGRGAGTAVEAGYGGFRQGKLCLSQVFASSRKKGQTRCGVSSSIRRVAWVNRPSYATWRRSAPAR